MAAKLPHVGSNGIRSPGTPNEIGVEVATLRGASGLRYPTANPITVSPLGISWHYRTELSFPNSEAAPVGYRIPGTASEAGGRAFESRPGHHFFQALTSALLN